MLLSLTFKASLSGRVRDAGAKGLLAKQLQGVNANLPEFLNTATGAIKTKKAKKEKTPEEEAVVEMKKLSKKCFVWQKVTSCSSRFEEYNTRKLNPTTHRSQ